MKRFKTVLMLLGFVLCLISCDSKEVAQVVEATIITILQNTSTTEPSSMFEATITKTVMPSPTSTNTPTITKTIIPSPTSTLISIPAASSTPELRLIKLHEWVVSPQDLHGNIIWTPNGDRFVILSGDGVEMYDTDSFERHWLISPPAAAHYASGAVFTSNGNLIIYRHISGIEVRDTETGELLAGDLEEINKKCSGDAFGMAIAPDDKTLYIGVNSTFKGSKSATIYKWDISTLKCLGSVAKFPGFRRFLEHSMNSSYLAIGTTSNVTDLDDGEVADQGKTWLWDMELERQTCEINYPLSTFWPETNVLVVPSIDKLEFWIREYCELSREIVLDDIPAPYALAINPRESWLAMSRDRIWIIDLFSGDILLSMDDLLLKNIFGFYRNLYSILSFSPDGRLLLFAVPHPDHDFKSLLVLWKLEK